MPDGPTAKVLHPNRIPERLKRDTHEREHKAIQVRRLRRKTDGNLANIIHRELAFDIELAAGNDFDFADHATSEQAYAVAMKFLTTLADPADVAALHQKASQLRKATDERVQTKPA